MVLVKPGTEKIGNKKRETSKWVEMYMEKWELNF